MECFDIRISLLLTKFTWNILKMKNKNTAWMKWPNSPQKDFLAHFSNQDEWNKQLNLETVTQQHKVTNQSSSDQHIVLSY